MGDRLLNRALAVGVMMVAFGVGLTIDGTVAGGLALVAGGAVISAYPLASLVIRLRGAFRGGATPSDAIADPVVRRWARAVGAILMVLSVPWFLAGGAVLYGFWHIAHGDEDGGSTGALVAFMILGCVLAGVPALLGGSLYRSGAMVWRGDLDWAGSASRLLRIVVGLGALATIGSVLDDRPQFDPVIVPAGCVTVVYATAMLLLMLFDRRVEAYFRAGAVPHRP